MQKEPQTNLNWTKSGTITNIVRENVKKKNNAKFIDTEGKVQMNSNYKFKEIQWSSSLK